MNSHILTQPTHSSISFPLPPPSLSFSLRHHPPISLPSFHQKMKDEWWLKAAISNDKLVANLLLHLKHSPSPSPSPSPYSFLLNPLPPSWGLRHPRSKPSSTSSSSLSPPENITTGDSNGKKITRRSPTTPLSWSGGSPSEDGCEESSQVNSVHPVSDRFRSKISVASDTPTTSSKRPRKRKTFAELKEEESSLLNERIYLQKKLEALHMTLKEQRSLNENLKRIKLDLHGNSGIKSESKSDHEKRNSILSLSCESKQDALSQEPVFALPDLNMVPNEENDLVGMS